MADLWTSNADMTGKLIQELRASKDQNEAVARALQQKNSSLEREIQVLQELLLNCRMQLSTATSRRTDEAIALNYLSLESSPPKCSEEEFE